jgi:hypothetical protein
MEQAAHELVDLITRGALGELPKAEIELKLRVSATRRTQEEMDRVAQAIC